MRELSPADSSIGSPESRAAARAMVDQKNAPFQEALVGFDLADLPGTDAVKERHRPVPPDSVTHYAMEDGSIIQVIARHYTGHPTAGIFQAWPDGRPYDYHKEKCFARSLAELKAMADAGKAREIGFTGFPGHEYVTNFAG